MNRFSRFIRYPNYYAIRNVHQTTLLSHQQHYLKNKTPVTMMGQPNIFIMYLSKILNNHQMIGTYRDSLG